MRVFRLVKGKYAATAMDGEGAKRVGGRWNAPGAPMAYCASTLSLAILELLVHVDPRNIPSDLVAVEVEIPEDVPPGRLFPADLPADWREDSGKEALQAMGNTWLAACNEAALKVPSVIVPSEWNVLVNPHHSDAARIQVVGQQPYQLDPRLKT